MAKLRVKYHRESWALKVNEIYERPAEAIACQSLGWNPPDTRWSGPSEIMGQKAIVGKLWKISELDGSTLPSVVGRIMIMTSIYVRET